MRVLSIFMALYFFLGSLFPGLDFSQLGKVGVAFEHYQVHLQEPDNPEESGLINFFLDHYLHPHSHQHPDDPVHQEMPFRSVHQMLEFVNFDAQDWTGINPFVVGFTLLNFTYQRMFSAEYRFGLLQPPNPAT